MLRGAPRSFQSGISSSRACGSRHAPKQVQTFLTCLTTQFYLRKFQYIFNLFARNGIYHPLTNAFAIVGTECCSGSYVFSKPKVFSYGTFNVPYLQIFYPGVGPVFIQKKKPQFQDATKPSRQSSSPERMCPPTVAAFSMTQTLNSSLPAWNRDEKNTRIKIKMS